MDEWNTNIENDIVRPIAKKAINLYADEVLENKTLGILKVVDEYKVRLTKNPILGKYLFPCTMETQYMIDVEVQIKNRWFVGICYKMKNGKWIEDDELKTLTTY